MAASLFNKDKIFAIFALNGSMGKTFFTGPWLLAAGRWLLFFSCWPLASGFWL
jgi:hypothetical protein